MFKYLKITICILFNMIYYLNDEFYIINYSVNIKTFIDSQILGSSFVV